MEYTQEQIGMLKTLYLMNYNFIACDRNGDLFAYKERPYKDESMDAWDIHYGDMHLLSEYFSFVDAQWEDETPLSICKAIDYVEWCDIPPGTPVQVSSNGQDWAPAIFSHIEDGHLYTAHRHIGHMRLLTDNEED